MDKITKLRGTRDIFPDESNLFRYLDNVSIQTFHQYGYEEIRIPTFENESLFSRSIGHTTDIVEKEMYVFNDRKGRRLALRPEGTAGVVRAYIENNLAKKKALTKLFYSGQMFRYERPQSGRYREFYQIGAEYFGSAHSVADTEIMMLTLDILNKVGINHPKLVINSIGCNLCRKKYRDALLASLKSKSNKLCSDCQKRLVKNPLRVLDCKQDREQFRDLVNILEYLCADCQDHFYQLKTFLDSVGCEYETDPYLVRGIDYYTRTIFEIKVSEDGTAIAAGGRYDNLVKDLGGPEVPACGFALGVERVIAFMQKSLLDKEKCRRRIFVAIAPRASSTGNVTGEGLKLAHKLRKLGIVAFGPLPDKSLKSQLRLADSLEVNYVVLLGEEEINKNTVIIKNMDNKTQHEVKQENLMENIC